MTRPGLLPPCTCGHRRALHHGQPSKGGYGSCRHCSCSRFVEGMTCTCQYAPPHEAGCSAYTAFKRAELQRAHPIDPPQHLTKAGRAEWYAARQVAHDKERIASRLRADIHPSEVMAEVRLREVVNGSPGGQVSVSKADLRAVLLGYDRALREWHPPDGHNAGRGSVP